MISFTWNNTDKELIARLQKKGPSVIQALIIKLNALMLRLQSKIVNEKLREGNPLHTITGNLARSIVAIPAVFEADRVIARVEGASGTAWYGRVHEFGGTGAYDIYPVNKKALAFFSNKWTMVPGGGMMLRTEPVTHGKGIIQAMRSTGPKRRAAGIAAFGASGGIVTKHVLHPPMPKRPFMAPALEEMRGVIISELNDAIMNTLKE